MINWNDAEKWELLERIHQLNNEITLLDEAYDGYFPDPSAQLDAMNDLNDEWQYLQNLLDKKYPQSTG